MNEWCSRNWIEMNIFEKDDNNFNLIFDINEKINLIDDNWKIKMFIKFDDWKNLFCNKENSDREMI